ncbi:uncharacterized protein PADG_07544 [Paracoccidioides brasiliensis Pb18]|uniref:Aminotransferase class I/classII large domain-containing protein n=1 Tax=Paracoccidioides brasiliensis (strain Pb18) TaxID=502780 RepID=C1GJV8_PARBD|nr:uncharacterized protein PADG_07544 [Paracoccidioides brasiliensis Pb18]EEH42724.2 hypothetical protein PADG_07544 [Paracoccidioides brasiliensis Pb18]
MNHSQLSARGSSNVASITPSMRRKIIDGSGSDTSDIDLSTDENYLLREELTTICKAAVHDGLHSQHFSRLQGFAGDPALLGSLALLLNNYFNPHEPVRPHHIVTAPGATSCLDALLYNICDPEDGVLVPGPFWHGDEVKFRARSSVRPILVNAGKFTNNFTMKLIPALEDAMDKATCTIKALIITNPHKFYGLCYPLEVLEACLIFCQQRGLHFISDEGYGMTSYSVADDIEPEPFISALALDTELLECDRSRIHVIWSISKDFGASGFRVGCIVTQDNRDLTAGLAVASNAQVSSLSAIFTAKLLSSPKLPFLVALNSARLAESYILITSFFIRHHIEYIPVNAGLNILTRLAPRAKTWEDESEMITRLKNAGVLVRGGGGYHGTQMEKGWVRISFALEEERLQESLRRIKVALHIE